MGRIEIGQVLGLNDMLDLIYPIGGNPYIQFANTPTPAEIFYNTSWEIDTSMQGRTIVGSGENYIFGEIGGSADAILVAHNHRQQSWNVDGTAYFASTQDSGDEYGVVGTTDASTTGAPLLTQNVGESGVGKNMPPYTVVNFWKRVA